MNIWDLKEMPHNTLCERNLIWCLFLDNDLFYELVVTPEQLYHPEHKKILAKMKKLRSSSMTIDYATMISDDIDNNELSDCMLSVMSTSGFQTYQKQIQECDVYRKLIRLSSEVITQSYDQKDIINILNLLRNQIDYCAWEEQPISFIESVQSVIDSLWTAQNKICNYGYKELDKMTNGIKEWQLIIVWARPKVGKTSMMLWLLDNIARQWIYVWAYTLEMKQYEMATRYVSEVSWVSTQWLQLVKDDNNKKMISDKTFSCIWCLENIYIRDNLVFADAIMNDIIRQVKKLWTKIIFIDYLWLIKSNEKRWWNKAYEIQDITMALKSLAKDLNIWIVLFCQINRWAEKENRRPIPSDLRDSGSIEQDADVVILLHRDLKDDINYMWIDWMREMTIDLALQRNWPSDSFEVWYHWPTMTIVWE